MAAQPSLEVDLVSYQRMIGSTLCVIAATVLFYGSRAIRADEKEAANQNRETEAPLKVKASFVHRFADEAETEGLVVPIQMKSSDFEVFPNKLSLKIRLSDAMHEDWYVVRAKGFMESPNAKRPIPMNASQISIDRPINKSDLQRESEIELLDLHAERKYGVLVYLFPRHEGAKVARAQEAIAKEDAFNVVSRFEK